MFFELFGAYGSSLLGGLQSLPLVMTFVSYVLTSLALYEMAQRRGIHQGWLSWVPILNVFILGSLSDQYHYVVRGEIRSKRKILLAFKILVSLLTGILTVIAGAALCRAIVYSYGSHPGYRIYQNFTEMLFRLGGMVLLQLPFYVILLIFEYMALYDIYRSCDPKNAVMYLVISILVPMTRPFFLFFSREKELGMPPRKGQIPVPYQNPPPAAASGEEQEQPQAVPEDSHKEAPEYL